LACVEKDEFMRSIHVVVFTALRLGALSALLVACSLDKHPMRSAELGLGKRRPAATPVVAGDSGTDSPTKPNAKPDSAVPETPAGGADICDQDASPGGATCDEACCGQRDGCCPSGCKPARDEDCAVRCGNGRTEAGEECDGDERCARDCRRLFDAALVHRYSFVGSGTRALDSVGDADGAIVDADLQDEGRLELRGRRSGAHVRLPAGLLSGLRSASIEAWVTVRDEGVWQRIFDFGNHAAGDDGEQQGTSFWYLTPRSDRGRILTQLNFTADPWDPDNDYSVEGPMALSLDETHQVVTTFDAATRVLRLYVDGRELGSTDVKRGSLSQIDDRNVLIGASQYELDPALSATLDEFRVYDAALSPAAVARSFQLGPDPEARP
jgi:hypothetical protein